MYLLTLKILNILYVMCKINYQSKMRRIFILPILLLCLAIKCLAMGETVCQVTREKTLVNLYGYGKNICRLGGEEDVLNFQKLEESVRILEQVDINNFELDFWEANVSTKAKIKATSLSNALRKYLKKYVKACNSCCVPKNINKCDGTELQKLYFKELKKYGISVD